MTFLLEWASQNVTNRTINHSKHECMRKRNPNISKPWTDIYLAFLSLLLILALFALYQESTWTWCCHVLPFHVWGQGPISRRSIPNPSAVAASKHSQQLTSRWKHWSMPSGWALSTLSTLSTLSVTAATTWVTRIRRVLSWSLTPGFTHHYFWIILGYWRSDLFVWTILTLWNCRATRKSVRMPGIEKN